MQIALHKNVRATPAVRADIVASNDSARVLSLRYGITELTTYKCKKRKSAYSRTHSAPRLQTPLTPAQESVVVHLHKALLPPLIDLLAVPHKFINDKVSRSGMDASAKAFFNAWHKAFPSKTPKLLTDNSQEFTNRPCASREREGSHNHAFDPLRKQPEIAHCLTKPRTTPANGMVKRFNGCIANVLKTYRFNSSEDLAQKLTRYAALYNHLLPQPALQSKAPTQTMKQCSQTHPKLPPQTST